MNLTPTPSPAGSPANAGQNLHQQALAILSQPGNRGAIVTIGDDGSLQITALERGKSVVNVFSPELLDHLSASPIETAWLVQLRNYCTARLAARAEARRSGGFVIPRDQRWEIVHAPAFEPLKVQG